MIFSVSYKHAVAWNILSTAFSGVCGFIVLLTIGGVYGPEVLGGFNQVYAFYIVCSQFGAFGIHLSLSKHLAEFDGDKVLCRVVFSSGIAGSFVVSLLFSWLLWLSKGLIGKYFGPDVGYGVGLVSLGVFFFSINKSLLFSLNGMNLMKEYAIFQGLRFLFLLGSLLLLIVLQVEGKETPCIFPIAEGLLFLCLTFFCRGWFSFRDPVLSEFISWGRRHFFFGLRSFGGHILLLLNTRIDVLFLGYFADDRLVGIYSMAAIFAEAACQLPTVFRTVYSPHIVKFVTWRRIDDLLSLLRRSRVLLWTVMFFASIVGYFFIYLLLPVLTGKPEYREAAPLFALLMAGVTIASGYMPFEFILVSGGFPGTHTVMILLLVVVNIIGNFCLIPMWGGVGAAIATSIANLCLIPLLKYYSKRCLDIAI